MRGNFPRVRSKKYVEIYAYGKKFSPFRTEDLAVFHAREPREYKSVIAEMKRTGLLRVVSVGLYRLQGEV